MVLSARVPSSGKYEIRSQRAYLNGIESRLIREGYAIQSVTRGHQVEAERETRRIGLPQVAEASSPRQGDVAGGCLLYHEYLLLIIRLSISCPSTKATFLPRVNTRRISLDTVTIGSKTS